MRGRPLRIRLTAAFASVVALVLLATGVLVFFEFARDLENRTDEELRDRQTAVVTLAQAGRPAASVVALSGEGYAQLYGPAGRVLASSRTLAGARLLTPADVRVAGQHPVFLTRPAPGSDDGARVRAFPIAGGNVAAIGEPLEDRESELRRLAILLGLTLPAALLLASLAGYQVARGALIPVERMRAQAASIGHGDLSQRLPAPGTHDELDRLAETLNDLLDRLEGALERERRIVGDASHELRTPIAVLRTRVDVALRGEQDQSRLRAALEDASRDAARLSRLADDLLVLARADQGQLPLRPQPLDVQDLLEEAIARHHTAAAEAGRRLVLGQLIDGGSVVLADPDRSAQALDNLIVNALHHGAGAVELIAVREGDHVALSVRDHGDGFPPEFLPRALERFSQAGGETAAGGSGLGLAIAAALVRAQGGEARAANIAGGGAVVTITLPLA
jgi:two-component system OmpR family sensor kinase